MKKRFPHLTMTKNMFKPNILKAHAQWYTERVRIYIYLICSYSIIHYINFYFILQVILINEKKKIEQNDKKIQ